jgi:hypothetical protein
MRQHQQGRQQRRNNVSNNICASTSRDASISEVMSAKTYALAGSSAAKKTYRFIQHHDLYRWTESIFKYLAEARKKSIRIKDQSTF